MAQTDLVEDLGAAYVALEASFATGGTDVRMFPVQGTWKLERTQEQLPVENLKVRPHDVTPNVKARKSCKGGFEYFLAPHLTRLTKGTALPTDDPLQVILTAVLGGCSHQQGTQVDDALATATVDSFPVDAGDGAKLPDGQLCLVDTGGATGFQVARVINRNVNAIEVYPDLGAIPADNADVIGMATYYLTPTNTQSLRFSEANAQSAAQQKRGKGCVTALELTFQHGSLVKVTASFEGADYEKGTLGLTRTHAVDVLGKPFSMSSSILYCQPKSVTTRTPVTCDSFSLKISADTKLTETLTGGTEGKRSVVRSADLEKAYANVEIVFPADTAWEPYYEDDEPLFIGLVLVSDTADGRRACFVDMPNVVQAQLPDDERGGDKLKKTKIMGQCQYDTSTTAPHDNEALATSPLRVGIG